MPRSSPMTEYRDMLERELGRLSPPRIPFEELAGRRDRRRRDQRIRAAVLGLAIAVAMGWWGLQAIRSAPQPADDPKPTPTGGELRRGGEALVFQPSGTGQGWDLTARDPDTGEARTIVQTDGIVDCPNRSYFRCTNFVNFARWSSD